jgi:hypothetical protein
MAGEPVIGPVTEDSAPRAVGVYALLARMVGWSGLPRAAWYHAFWWRNPGPGQTCAPLAQSAERLHGKEKVYGSIP